MRFIFVAFSFLAQFECVFFYTPVGTARVECHSVFFIVCAFDKCTWDGRTSSPETCSQRRCCSKWWNWILVFATCMWFVIEKALLHGGNKNCVHLDLKYQMKFVCVYIRNESHFLSCAFFPTLLHFIRLHSFSIEWKSLSWIFFYYCYSMFVSWKMQTQPNV